VYSSGVDVLNDSKASAKVNDQNRTPNTWRWMGQQLPRSTNLGQRREEEKKQEQALYSRRMKNNKGV
jgi:hypothetical protein